MDNLVKTYFADSQLNVNADGNAVLNKAGTLEGATISGDLIIGDGAAEGDVVLKDVTVSGRLLVRGGGTSTVTLEGNTTVSNIVVNKPTGAVRVENNTEKTVNVNAVSDNVVLTGEYDQVNANASQGTITLNDADVATMNVAGTSAKVVVENGSTVTTMSVTGADATVKAEEGAKIEKITTSAANTSVSGQGSVANFEAAQGSSGASITTDGTKVVNNGTGNVTTGNDKVIASGSTGTSQSDSTTPGGGGSTGGGGGSVVESSDVVVAPMVDQAADNGIASEDLCSSYSVSGTVNGDVHTIKITAKDVMLHTNQQQVAGHWVGFGIPAAEDNEYYAGFGSVPADLGSPVSSIAERTYEVNGKTYNTVYFSGDTEDEYKNGAYVVVKNGDKTTTYNITFDVSFFKADVSVLTAIPEVILDAYDEASLPIRHKTAEGLGLDAATDGTTVTLSGETTTDKLDATDVATQNGYLLYGFNVGSKLITQLGGTVTPNPMSLADFSDGGTVSGAVPMNNAALLNIQIWDNDNSSFIKKTVSLELKDAAGRVQDTVELTVDATGCKIEGQHSVTFKDAVDGNTIQSISVENDGTVTLPSNPSKEGFKFLGWYSDEDTEFTAETHVTANMTVYAKWENIIEAVNNAEDKSALQTVLETEGNEDALGIAVSSGDYSTMAVSRKPSVANYVLESKPEGGYTTAAEIQAAFNMGVRYEAGKWALSEKIKANASTVSDFNTLKAIYEEHAAYRASIGQDVGASEVYTDAMKAFDRVDGAIIAKVHEQFADEDNNAGDSEFTNPYKLNSVFDYIIACAPETVDEVNTALRTEKMNLAEVTVKDLTVAEGETLTIPEGKTLVVAKGATLTVNGTIEGEGTVKGTDVTLNQEDIPAFSKLVQDGTTKVWIDDTSEWVEYTQQQAALREGNGPGKPGTDSFDYGAAYTEAGVTWNEDGTGFTVDQAKVNAFIQAYADGQDDAADKAYQLTQPSGELDSADGLFVGVKFAAPSGVDTENGSVYVYRDGSNLSGTNDAYQLTQDSADGTGGDVFANNFTNYLVFAKAEQDAQGLADKEWSYVLVWQNEGKVVGVSHCTITRTVAPDANFGA